MATLDNVLRRMDAATRECLQYACRRGDIDEVREILLNWVESYDEAVTLAAELYREYR